MGRTSFSIWPTAAILNFKIQVLPLDNSLSAALWGFLYQRGPLQLDLKSKSMISTNIHSDKG